MHWIKDTLIDLAVTAVIVIFAFTQAQWAWWVIVIYTPLMVLLKLAALGTAVGALASKKKSDVPAWFYHVLYALSVTALAYAEWWIMAGAWALIWVLSIAAEMRPGIRPRTASR